MGGVIRRRTVLQEMDVKRVPGTDEQVVFSIEFDRKDGVRVFYPRAVNCGLKMDIKANRVRGVLQVDRFGDKMGHPVPVGIDRIVRFNGMEVVL